LRVAVLAPSIYNSGMAPSNALRQLSRATFGMLLALLVLFAGCKKKKEPIPQPQEQAPTISQPQTQPQPPAAPSEKSEEQPPATAAKPKPKTAKKPSAKKTTPAAPAKSPEAPKPAETSKSKTVVEEGGSGSSTPGQLSAGLPQTEAMHQRQSTVQLQQATENNLRSITRMLTSDEQSMVQHIRNYMQQSRAAEADGDTERAYNLAMKAHLLSIELVKR